jgi:hypothetical protein
MTKPVTMALAVTSLVLWQVQGTSSETASTRRANSEEPAQLAAPTELVASVSGNTVALQWVAGALPVTSYIVEVGSLRGHNDVAVFDTGSAATSLVAVDVPARIYWVRLRGRHGTEISLPSNDAHVVVSTGPCFDTPFPPLGWLTSGKGSSVTLTWDSSFTGCPPTDYIIEARSAAQATDTTQYRTGTSATPVVAHNVPAGTYYVRLRSAYGAMVSSQTEERIVVVGSNSCVYSVGPSALFISKAGLNGYVSIAADADCPWTVSTDASWLQAFAGPFPISGTGVRTLTFGAIVNSAYPRFDKIHIRWPGGGADVPVTQNGLLPFPSFPSTFIEQ